MSDTVQEQIALLIAAGYGVREIMEATGASKSTVDKWRTGQTKKIENPRYRRAIEDMLKTDPRKNVVLEQAYMLTRLEAMMRELIDFRGEMRGLLTNRYPGGSPAPIAPEEDATMEVQNAHAQTEAARRSK